MCRLCIQPGHIVRDCPSFKCFKCGKQGHYVRECNEGNCSVCAMRDALCVFKTPEDEERSLDLYDDNEEEEEEASVAEKEVIEETWFEREATTEQDDTGKENHQNSTRAERCTMK